MKPFRTLRDSQVHVALDVAGAVLILPGIWATLAFLQNPSSGMSARTFATMLPIAGLATAVLALIYTAVSRQLTKKFPNDDSGLRRLGTGPALLQVAAAFTLIACGLTALAVTMTTPTIPVAASLVVLSVAWLILAWLRQEELWVYLAGCGLASIYLYVRHGLYEAPFGPDFGKAFGVIGICFLFFGFNIAVSRNTISRLAVFRRPTFYSALFLPFVLLKVTPHGPTWTVSLAVFAVAAFYAFVARRERLQWTAYLSAILFNIAVYLWVPELSRSGRLLQLYVIPAAITVLVLAQLHRRDLSRQTLTGVRYAAAGAILAVSSLDAFSSASLTHFVLVLFLSLAGIVAGIALRIRPFVFVGLAFLVVNVLGQLGLQFQQHAALRAAILIGVGFVVIGIMVFLNIRREEILRKYRSFVADSRWE